MEIWDGTIVRRAHDSLCGADGDEDDDDDADADVEGEAEVPEDDDGVVADGPTFALNEDGSGASWPGLVFGFLASCNGFEFSKAATRARKQEDENKTDREANEQKR